MDNIIISAFTWILILVFLFNGKILEILKFDPNRARDLYGFYIIAIFCLSALYILDNNEISNVLIIGAAAGIPIGIFSEYLAFKKIRNNCFLSSNELKKRQLRLLMLLVLILLTPLSIYYFDLNIFVKYPEYKDISRSLFVFLYPFLGGIVVAGIIIRFTYILKYERKNGILYIEQKDT